MEAKLELPKKHAKFRIEKFFQLDVDEFEHGDFMFLSAKEVYTKTNKWLKDKTKNIDNKGWIISTYCYTYKQYHKIFVCEYKQMPWENHYHIESCLASLNGCDMYAVNESLDEFLSWFDYK